MKLCVSPGRLNRIFPGRSAFSSMGLVLFFSVALGQAPEPDPIDAKARAMKLSERNRLFQDVQRLMQQGESKLGDVIRVEQQILVLTRQIDGRDHDNVIGSLTRIEVLHRFLGNYDGARQCVAEIQALLQDRLGKDHWRVRDAKRRLSLIATLEKLSPEDRKLVKEAVALNQQALQLLQLGKAAEGAVLAERALEIRETLLGKDDPDYAQSLNNLGLMRKAMGHYAEAEANYWDALRIQRLALGADHPYCATFLSNLGGLYIETGDYVKAESCQRESLSIVKSARGESHLDYATSLNNLGALCLQTGDLLRAEAYHAQALEIRRRALAPAHPLYVTSLNNLATTYQALNKFPEAIELFQEALELTKRTGAERNSNYSTVVHNLATAYKQVGQYSDAERMQLLALELTERSVGKEHEAYATCLNNLGTLYRVTGDLKKAESRLRQAIEINAATVGKQHRNYAGSLLNLAAIHQERNELDEAEMLIREALDITDNILEVTSLSKSEREQLSHAAAETHGINGFVQFALAVGGRDESVYRYVLRAKGRIQARQLLIRAVDEDPRLKLLKERLQRVTSQLAQAALSSPAPGKLSAWKQELASLAEQRDALDKELSNASVSFRNAKSRPTMNEIRVQIAADTALLDFWEFYHYAPPNVKEQIKPRWERRLAVFIVTKDRPLQLLDLGPSETLTEALAGWRGKEERPDFGTSPAAQKAAHVLREKLWLPIERHLKGIKLVLVSPDGELSKLPLAALPGRKPGSYLIEQYAFALVPVPASLGRPAEKITGDRVGESLLAIGGINYDAKPGTTKSSHDSPSPRAPHESATQKYNELPGTVAEIRAAETLFRSRFPKGLTKQLNGDVATEAAFRAEAPQFRNLLLATHGYFAPPEVRSALSRNLGEAAGFEGLSSRQSLAGYHPDLLSGLVFAGANDAPEEGDDGILTAAEVRTLDLRRTDLVVLSACESGLGPTAGGEGVLGLQRAFQIAGAKHVVASLWKVDDQATQKLATEFYINLWQKKLPPSEALRQAQLKMLVAYRPTVGNLRAGFEDASFDETALAAARKKIQAGEAMVPPFYWAAFVLSGSGR